MKIRSLEYESAKEQIKEYEQGLVYYISSTEVIKPAQTEIVWEECLEARFFSDKSELRFFRDGSSWIVSMVSDDEGDRTIDGIYKAAGRFSSVGEKVKIREYYEPDEDGQMILTVKRLVSIS